MKGVGEGLRNGARLGVEVASPSVVLVLGMTWRMEDGEKRSAKRAAVATQARKRNGKWRESGSRLLHKHANGNRMGDGPEFDSETCEGNRGGELCHSSLALDKGQYTQARMVRTSNLYAIVS